MIFFGALEARVPEMHRGPERQAIRKTPASDHLARIYPFIELFFGDKSRIQGSLSQR